MWCVEDYIELIAAILFVIMLGKAFYRDHKYFRENEEYRELCRLRDRYKPGLNEELAEKKRLAELESKWAGGRERT
jgi:hypothetical protein